MANYTVELSEIIGSGVYDEVLFPTYVLYTSETCPDRSQILEEKIIANYFQHEIGYETIEAFLQRFHTVFNNFLPKYNSILKMLDTERKDQVYSRESDKHYDHTNIETPNLTFQNDGTIEYEGDSSRQENNTPYENYPAGSNYATFTESGDSSSKNTTSNTRKETGSKTDSGMSNEKSVHYDDAYMTLVSRIVGNYIDADMLFVKEFSPLFMKIY